jgi:uncharacterized protein (TIGR00288 family)
MSDTEHRIAVLIDCDNASPESVEHALRVVAQFGRVVVRRGYGNHQTLANKWQEVLVRLAFTPCLQYQYASGKNTSDIALALDALEAMFDRRADTFCLVTSDSDFAYLCRKLRERGATVYVVGESKTPEALRNASDQFFEWARPEPVLVPGAVAATTSTSTTLVQQAPASARPVPKRRPKFVVDAVDLLVGAASEGKVTLSALGSYLKRMDPGFTPQTYGHSGLLNMLRTYDLLQLQETGGHYSVMRAPVADAATEQVDEAGGGQLAANNGHRRWTASEQARVFAHATEHDGAPRWDRERDGHNTVLRVSAPPRATGAPGAGDATAAV